ncbi:MAG: ABC transporter ATP-binding protein [Candidatus Berkelbacteria bacterium]|nr:ABC transporter ATP-binding protein [Candidatus Berkelbacteria bacterium]
MLVIRNLTKQFYQRNEEITVVDNLSLTVKKGQVFGLIGPNGAGKTTTVKLVAGLLFPGKGKISIGGFPAGTLEAKRKIGFMNENPQFYYHLKAREVMEFVADLFEIEKTVATKKIDVLLKEVGLKDAKELAVRKFSKGMHQRLAFAVAQINNPELLILDEPLDGLDPLGRLDFKQMILKLKKSGATIFFSSHILSDVEEICDEVAILHKGKIIAQGSPKDLVKSSKQSLEELFVRSIRNA